MYLNTTIKKAYRKELSMDGRLNQWDILKFGEDLRGFRIAGRQGRFWLTQTGEIMTTLCVSGIISRSGPKESFFLTALQKLNRVHISASNKQRLLLEVEYPSRKESYPSPDNPSRFP